MPISALPTPPSRASSPATFSDDADAFLGALPTFRTEANELAADVNLKQTQAATSASEALTSANNAAASYDAFDNRYLGSKTSNPTTDNDGNTLLVGALYWNSVLNEMRIWNGSNWTTLNSLLNVFNNKTSAYTIISSDIGKIINCTSGNFTVSLTAAATLGAGFNCWVWNTGDTSTNAITIDPNGSETIDGLSTLILRRGEGVQIVCDGTNWQTSNKKVMRGYAENLSGIDSRPVATGAPSIALGSYNTASGDYSIALGSGGSSFFQNVASGISSIVVGTSNSAIGANSVAIGSYNSASGQSGVALGTYSISNKYGKFSYASGAFDVAGDAQTGKMVLRRGTTNATPTVLTSNGSTPNTENQIILSNSTTCTFTILVSARRQGDAGESAGYKFEGVVDRYLTAASTALVGTITKTVLAEDTAAWDCNVTADTINGGLKVEVTGEVGKTIRWVATCWTSEVTG